MKKYLLTLACCLAAACTIAQKIEITGGLHTTSMHYTGNGAEASSVFNSANQSVAYTNNPYGSKNGTGLGGDLQAQVVILKTFIAGAQGGYESLKSVIDITGGDIVTPSNNIENISLQGSTTLRSNFVIFNPYIGVRLPVPVVKIDLLAGYDFAHATSMREKGSAKDDKGQTYTVSVDRRLDRKVNDTRVRLGLAASFKRISVTAYYSRGLTNYTADLIGGYIPKTYTRIIRFGLSYQIF